MWEYGYHEIWNTKLHVKMVEPSHVLRLEGLLVSQQYQCNLLFLVTSSSTPKPGSIIVLNSPDLGYKPKKWAYYVSSAIFPQGFINSTGSEYSWLRL